MPRVGGAIAPDSRIGASAEAGNYRIPTSPFRTRTRTEGVPCWLFKVGGDSWHGIGQRWLAGYHGQLNRPGSDDGGFESWEG